MIRSKRATVGLSLGVFAIVAAVGRVSAGPAVPPGGIETPIPFHSPIVLKTPAPEQQVGFDVVLQLDPDVLTAEHLTAEEICPKFAIGIAKVVGKTSQGSYEEEKLGSGSPAWISESETTTYCHETFTDIPGGVPLQINVTYGGGGAPLTIGPTFVSMPTTLGPNEPTFSYTHDVYREFAVFASGVARPQPTRN